MWQNAIVERFSEMLILRQQVIKDGIIARQLSEMVAAGVEVLTNGGKIIFAGNGGSFADAMHLTAEFVSRFKEERRPLASLCLGANNSIITAIGNDYTYADVFVRELRALGTTQDLLIAISTSGNSANVVKLVDAALEIGIKIFCMTGESGGLLREKCPCICVPSKEVGRIQEIHISLGHIFCELVEREFVVSSI